MEINLEKIHDFSKNNTSLNSVVAILNDEKNIQDYPRELIYVISGGVKNLHNYYINQPPSPARKFVEYLIILHEIKFVYVNRFQKREVDIQEMLLKNPMISQNAKLYFPEIYENFWSKSYDVKEFNQLQQSSIISRLSRDDVFDSFVRELELLYILGAEIDGYCCNNDAFCFKVLFELGKNVNPFYNFKNGSLFWSLGGKDVNVLLGIMVHYPQQFVEFISNQDYLSCSSPIQNNINSSIEKNMLYVRDITNKSTNKVYKESLTRVFEIINSNTKYLNSTSLGFFADLTINCFNLSKNLNNISTHPDLPLMIRDASCRIGADIFKGIVNLVNIVNDVKPMFNFLCYDMEHLAKICNRTSATFLNNNDKQLMIDVSTRIYKEADLLTRTKLIEQWIFRDHDLEYEFRSFNPMLFRNGLNYNDIIFNLIKKDTTLSLKGLSYINVGLLFNHEIKNEEHQQKLDLIQDLYSRNQSLSKLTINLLNETGGKRDLPDLNSIIIKHLYTSNHNELFSFLNESENYFFVNEDVKKNTSWLIQNIKLMLKYPELQNEILGIIKQSCNDLILEYKDVPKFIKDKENLSSFRTGCNHPYIF